MANAEKRVSQVGLMQGLGDLGVLPSHTAEGS